MTIIAIFLSVLALGGEATAYFAGGCFWCMEPPFEKLKGVSAVISGYAGGTKANPAYREVASGKTKHREAVKVVYDPKQVSYSDLLEVFWRQIDPTDSGGQFVDRGYQYSTAIWFQSESERITAEQSKAKVQGHFKKPLHTPIEKFTTFYPAEDYHQDYYKKSELKYKFYRQRSGRDSFITRTWNRIDKEAQTTK